MEARNAGRYVGPVGIRSHRELRAYPGTKMLGDAPNAGNVPPA